jgi:hypothetical protein
MCLNHEEYRIQITNCIPSPIVSKEEEIGEFLKEYPHIYPKKSNGFLKTQQLGVLSLMYTY